MKTSKVKRKEENKQTKTIKFSQRWGTLYPCSKLKIFSNLEQEKIGLDIKLICDKIFQNMSGTSEGNAQKVEIPRATGVKERQC